MRTIAFKPKPLQKLEGGKTNIIYKSTTAGKTFEKIKCMMNFEKKNEETCEKMRYRKDFFIDFSFNQRCKLKALSMVNLYQNS